jgi:hypothetical protein
MNVSRNFVLALSARSPAFPTASVRFQIDVASNECIILWVKVQAFLLLYWIAAILPDGNGADEEKGSVPDETASGRSHPATGGIDPARRRRTARTDGAAGGRGRG